MTTKQKLSLMIALSLILILVATSIFASCAREEAPATPAKPAPAPAAETTVWRLQSQRIAAEPAMIYYKEMLESTIPELTDGRLQVKLYYGGELVKSVDCFEAISSGTIEMISQPSIYFKGILPEAAIEYGLPFGIRTPGERYNFMYGKELAGGFPGGWREIDFLRPLYVEHNIYYLAGAVDFWPASYMFTSPINSIEDIKGKKVRCSGTMQDWIQKLGGQAVYIPGEEAYTALATGAVDGVTWGSGMGMYSMKFHEVCKYFLLPALMPQNHLPFLVNMDVWNETPEDIKAITEFAFIKLGFDFTFHQNWTLEKWSINDMVQNHGVTVCELTGEDLRKAEEAAFEIWDEQAAISPNCAEYVEMKRDYMRTLGYIE